MRQIGELPSNANPRLLEDHLLGLGIRSRIDRRPDGWVVWIINEDHVEQARQELQSFLADPSASRYAETVSRAREVRQEEAKRDRDFRKNDRDAGELWRAPTWQSRPVTIITVGIAVLVFILQNSQFRLTTLASLAFFDPRAGAQEFRPHLGLTDILAGEVWRLVTPIFLHFSPLHIFFNCYWVLQFGTAIEMRRGRGKLLAIIIGSAILSNLGEYLFMEYFAPSLEGRTRFVLFGGLSGVNYALFGYVWMLGENHPEEGLSIDSRTTVILLGWLVLCFTGVVGPIANVAHLTGLAVGMALGVKKF